MKTFVGLILTVISFNFVVAQTSLPEFSSAGVKYKPNVVLFRDNTYNNIVVQDTVQFPKGTSSKSLKFKKTHFQSPFILGPDCSFLRLNFDSCVLHSIDMQYSSLLHEGKLGFALSMAGSDVKDGFYFDQMDISSIAVFATRFGGEFEMSSCKFKGDVNFMDNTFNQEVDISYIEFMGDANFSLSVFKGHTIFHEVTFFQAPKFGSTQLPDTLEFSDVNFSNVENDVYLNRGELDSLRYRTKDPLKKCVLVLDNTSVERLVIDHSKFQLGFAPEATLADKISIFQQVIERCRKIGLTESANEFDIDLIRMRLLNQEGIGKYWGKLNIAFQEYWWWFGYDKSLIFRNTFLAFLICFFVVFGWMRQICSAYFPDDQLSITREEATKISFSGSLFSRLSSRFKISFFYTALIFFGFKLDHSKVQYREHPWTSFLVYCFYTIGIIHLAYLAGYIIAT